MIEEENRFVCCCFCKHLISDQFGEFKCELSNNTIHKNLISDTVCDNFIKVKE